MQVALDMRRRPDVVDALAARRQLNLDTLKADNGLLEVWEVARKLDRTPRVIWRHIWQHNLGQSVMVLGLKHTLLNGDDVNRLRSITTSSSLHNDPRRRSQWYYALHKNTKMYGRKAAELAKEQGNQVGRPRELMTIEKEQRIVKLAAQGRSQRGIAYIVGVSRGTVRHVLARNCLPAQEVG